MSSEFILGFVAGEGSFYVSVSERANSRVKITPAFSIKVYEMDVLQSIKEELGVGKIDKYEDEYSLNVQSRPECEKVRKFVNENCTRWFKSTHKYEQFKKWCSVLDILSNWERNNPPKDEKMKEAVDLAYSIARTNTREETKDYWYSLIDESERYTCGEERTNGDICNRPVTSKNEACVWHNN